MQDRFRAEQTRIAGTASPTPLPTPSATVPPTHTPTATAPRALSEQEAVARVLPAVVRVVAPGGSGSGVIVDSDGLVVTNEHVVERTRSVEVRLRDGRSLRATVVQRDAEADLATLRLEESGLPTAPLGDADRLALGEPLMAIGYALGFRGDPSITRGVFSGLRTGPRAEYVQTDAAINPGNSGGPLVSLRGEVVGINSFGIRGTQRQPVEGVNFAISSNSVREFLTGAARTPSESPDEIVRRYYRLVDAHDYPAAYELLSSGLRSQADLATFVSWFDDKRSIYAESVSPARLSNGTARVTSIVVSSDWLRGRSGPLTTARYRETWGLVHEGGWRLDVRVETTRLAGMPPERASVASR